MSRMKNPKFYELALYAGGSHYPDVGGPLLEQYSRLLLEEVYKICDEHPTWNGLMISEHIKQHFNEQTTEIA